MKYKREKGGYIFCFGKVGELSWQTNNRAVLNSEVCMMYMPERISEVGSKVVMSHTQSEKLDTKQGIAFIHKCGSQNNHRI